MIKLFYLTLASTNTSTTLILTAMEWERPETQSAFRDYIVKHNPGIAVEEVVRQVGKWPDYL